MPIRLLFVTLFLLMASVARCQSRLTNTPLPAYNQIKPASHEIYDYLGPRGTVNRSVQGIARLFEYPDSETTYVVNGKIVSNATAVRQQIAKQGMYIDSLSIGQPDANGKRLIRIRLLPDKL